jgi:hypothetical protein
VLDARGEPIYNQPAEVLSNVIERAFQRALARPETNTASVTVSGVEHPVATRKSTFAEVSIELTKQYQR